MKFPVHKWQSDVEHLESKDSTNPSQGQQKHPKVQWKDSRLQPFFYVEGGLFGEKLVAHAHEQIMRLKTMAHVRTDGWIPKLKSKVKKVINQCNNMQSIQHWALRINNNN